MDKKLLFVDTETTGLSKLTNGIIAISLLVDINGALVDQLTLEINPLSYKRPIAISPKALEINGYKEEQFAGFLPAREALTSITALMGKYVNKYDAKDKFIFNAYNSEFDAGFLQELFIDCGSTAYANYLDYRHLDVYALVKYLVHTGAIGTGYRQTLEAACKATGITLSDAHNSLSDVLATRELHHYLVNTYLGGVKCV
ncbi:MAG: 3'-5' exonuclease [Candidatus Dojkabacteria bacterium]|jgi:DNA polymerase III epsilon subunit-like protein|nr:3'-5' exonuclease [Candidatus Dojkabacteria bacterium]MDX9738911.1 3'-5' exonuclease [Candidatus Dojkabacteria bacterium]